MPLFALELAAVCENIAEILPAENRSWGLQFRCGSCREAHPNFVDVDPEEQVQVQASTYNCCFKCKFCQSKISASVMPRSEGKYVDEKGPGAQKIVVFDCRGGEPIKLQLDNQWKAVGSGDSRHGFDEVDLSQDWADYDEKAQISVMISEVEATFTGVKN